MRTILLVLICIFNAVTCIYAQSVEGTWFTEAKDAKVSVYKENGKLYGKIVWLEKDNGVKGTTKDLNNPDSSLRNTPLVGKLIFRDLVEDDGEWEDGTIYDPKSGKSYDCTIWLEDDKLNVRGSLSIFHKTEVWTISE